MKMWSLFKKALIIKKTDEREYNVQPCGHSINFKITLRVPKDHKFINLQPLN